MTTESSKVGFLSLEYIKDGLTYWLESNHAKKPPFFFRVIPMAPFEGIELHTNHLIFDSDYSEITVWSDNGVMRYMFSASQNTDAAPISLDINHFPTLSWNEAFTALATAGVKLEDLTGFWHRHIVRASDAAPECFKRDLNYLMTAWLLNELLFCVMGEDYKMPDNPNMVTVHCENEAAFLEQLGWFVVYSISFQSDLKTFYLV